MTDQVNRLIRMAIELQKNGNLTEARSMYLEALQIEPDNHQIYKILSSLEHQSRNFDKSIKYIDEAIKFKKNLSELYSIKGFYLYTNNKEQEAKDFFEKALKIDPNNIDALLNLGVILKDNNETKKAINYFDRIISLSENNYKALVNRAYIKLIQETIKTLLKILTEFLVQIRNILMVI